MILEKTICVVTLVPITVAVIDPSITSISLAVIAALVVLVPIWFKFKTDSMLAKLKEQDARINDVIKTSDGMKDALVRATSTASHAVGMAEGVAQAETKAAVQAVAKAEGKAEAKLDAQVIKPEIKERLITCCFFFYSGYC